MVAAAEAAARVPSPENCDCTPGLLVGDMASVRWSDLEHTAP
eukprot:SAG31_NODE_38197_length_298_cov_0.773869_1_plen_41_part_10